MKPVASTAFRLPATFALGIAAGLAVRHLISPEETTAGTDRKRTIVSAPGVASAPRSAAAPAWIPALQQLDPVACPRYSRAFLAAFCEAAGEAITKDPSAAVDAFLAAPDLHRTATVEVFMELLCETHPLLAMRMSSKLPSVFEPTVQWMVLDRLACADPGRALTEIQTGSFSRISREWVYNAFGKGVAESGDVSRLSLIKASLMGEELSSALSGFAEGLAKVQPMAALEAAKANPEISGDLTRWAAVTFWRSGDVDEARECLAGADPARTPLMMKDFAGELRQMPPEALLPAFRHLMQLLSQNSKLLPLEYQFTACVTVKDRVTEMSPERLAEYAAEAPEGELRDYFSRP